MNLRDFLSQLEKEKKLTRIIKDVSTKYEIANIIYSLNEQPVIFENVNGYPSVSEKVFHESRDYKIDTCLS